MLKNLQHTAHEKFAYTQKHNGDIGNWRYMQFEAKFMIFAVLKFNKVTYAH